MVSCGARISPMRMVPPEIVWTGRDVPVIVDVSRLSAFCGMPSFVKSRVSPVFVEVQRNPKFLALLQKTDLNVPDGSGLLWAAKKYGKHLPERVSGVDLVQAICAASGEKKLFLLGAEPGVAEQAAHALQLRYPSL